MNVRQNLLGLVDSSDLRFVCSSINYEVRVIQINDLAIELVPPIMACHPDQESHLKALHLKVVRRKATPLALECSEVKVCMHIRKSSMSTTT